jgi:hypothetical protein
MMMAASVVASWSCSRFVANIIASVLGLRWPEPDPDRTSHPE